MSECYCVTKINGEIVIRRTRGQHPPGCIGHVDPSTPVEDLEFIVETETGEFVYCPKKKSEWLKEQIKNAISE